LRKNCSLLHQASRLSPPHFRKKIAHCYIKLAGSARRILAKVAHIYIKLAGYARRILADIVHIYIKLAG
jgi:hypothetical protein